MTRGLATFILLLTTLPEMASQAHELPTQLRIATYNISFFREKPGELLRDLNTGDDPSAKKIAEVIQRVRPDVILLNEVDYDASGQVLEVFQQKYLAMGQSKLEPVEFPYTYTAPVNTGEPSGLDLNQNGTIGDPEDAWGFGQYPGKYGMAILSKYPIDLKGVRTFQKLKWSSMPQARRPVDPKTGRSFYPDDIWKELRVSSKSHWDVPVIVRKKRLHLLCSHPIPPVFDGPEDRNGCRNFDEIRLIADYLSPDQSSYLVDDRGMKGGLPTGESFVILGDLNADPVDGDSIRGAIQQLLNHPLVNAQPTPTSRGGIAAVFNPKQSTQRGDPAQDTGKFGEDGSTNLRADYVLPSRDLKVLKSGVFWPAPGEEGAGAVDGTDHRAVWIDIVP